MVPVDLPLHTEQSSVPKLQVPDAQRLFNMIDLNTEWRDVIEDTSQPLIDTYRNEQLTDLLGLPADIKLPLSFDPAQRKPLFSDLNYLREGLKDSPESATLQRDCPPICSQRQIDERGRLRGPNPRHYRPVPPWTPEVHTDPITGAVHSLSGRQQIYPNGKPYPGLQLYVYNKTAQILPAYMRNYDPWYVPPSTAEGTEPFTASMRDMKWNENITYDLHGNPLDFGYVGFDQNNLPPPPTYCRALRPCLPIEFPRPSISGMHFNEQHASEPYKTLPAMDNWPEVYKIYGTAIGVIIKHMNRLGCSTKARSDVDNWLKSQGFPFPQTQTLLDIYYCTDPGFWDAGQEVVQGNRQPNELRDIVGRMVTPSYWPGDMYFVTMRDACEYFRKRALEYLDSWGNPFETALRGRGRGGGRGRGRGYPLLN